MLRFTTGFSISESSGSPISPAILLSIRKCCDACANVLKMTVECPLPFSLPLQRLLRRKSCPLPAYIVNTAILICKSFRLVSADFKVAVAKRMVFSIAMTLFLRHSDSFYKGPSPSSTRMIKASRLRPELKGRRTTRCLSNSSCITVIRSKC